MQVNVIPGGSDAFNALLYPPPTQEKIQRYTDKVNNVVNVLGGLGGDFISGINSIYNKFASSEAIAAAKSVIHKAGIHNNEYMVLPYTYDNIHTANLGMQQYIMANLEVNQLYKDDMCFGFQDTYYNTEPNVFGSDRLDYRRVTDSMLQFEDNSGEGYVKYYSSSDEVPELDLIDKLAVLNTWDAVSALIADNIDPTDPDRGML